MHHSTVLRYPIVPEASANALKSSSLIVQVSTFVGKDSLLAVQALSRRAVPFPLWFV